jgi:hypothetical protein
MSTKSKTSDGVALGAPGAYMRHAPNKLCECHDCHVARTRGVAIPEKPVTGD